MTVTIGLDTLDHKKRSGVDSFAGACRILCVIQCYGNLKIDKLYKLFGTNVSTMPASAGLFDLQWKRKIRCELQWEPIFLVGKDHPLENPTDSFLSDAEKKPRQIPYILTNRTPEKKSDSYRFVR